jgi:glucuronate isomerase
MATELSPDRFFSPDPSQRSIARELYHSIKELPLVCPHGHVDPRLLADPDATFGSPADLFIIPDHYITRMLYSQGIELHRLGIRELETGSAYPISNQPVSNHREVWRLFCSNFHLFRGTPSGIWLRDELVTVFGIDEKPNASTADRLFDTLSEKLASPEFSPRRLFERFNIEVLCTTDTATDMLEYHQALRQGGWSKRILPTFRPDGISMRPIGARTSTSLAKSAASMW